MDRQKETVMWTKTDKKKQLWTEMDWKRDWDKMWTERKKCGWKDMQEQTEMDNRTGQIQKENTEMDRKKNVDKNGQEKTEIWTERQTWKKRKDGREKTNVD